jgi:hypothetical protein
LHCIYQLNDLPGFEYTLAPWVYVPLLEMVFLACQTQHEHIVLLFYSLLKFGACAGFFGSQV